MINSLLIYDLETNGYFDGNPNPLPIEIATILVTPDAIQISDKFVSTDLNGEEIIVPVHITDVTGITTEQLKRKGIALEELLKEFIPTTDAVMIIGHNIVRFDNLFVKHLTSIDLFGKTFDTAGEFKSRKIGWNKFPKASFADFHSKVLDVKRRGLKYNLDIACEEHGIRIRENRHHAIVDVIMTAELFLAQWLRYEVNYQINPATSDKLRDLINGNSMASATLEILLQETDN